jgi:hypothetical protein
MEYFSERCSAHEEEIKLLGNFRSNEPAVILQHILLQHAFTMNAMLQLFIVHRLFHFGDTRVARNSSAAPENAITAG